jgi:uncharacterized protein (TIGR02145 family)
MKKKFFLFAMLASAAASAQVTNVEPVSANYTNSTVSFRVWWNAGSRDATHLSKVWLWVDYITVNSDNTTSGNLWTRAVVSAASPTASVSYDGSNRKGFWLQGNSGSYSATITVQLNITETKFNWCAYVSDYPPNVTLDEGTYTFKGTTNFIVSSHVQPITTKTIAKANLTVNSSSTFTDATDCPGIGSLYCPYTGSDLYMDATHLCQKRASGAQNWEAWIKDTRDEELYRIVYMPDNKWWIAESMHYDASSSKQSYRCPNKAQHTIYNIPVIACPSGWILPSNADYNALVSVATLNHLKATGVCTGSDYYGYTLTSDQYGSNVAHTSYPSGNCLTGSPAVYMVLTSDNYRYHFFYDGSTYSCNVYGALGHPAVSWSEVRCLRQL